MIGIHPDWIHLAFYALALCFIYLPFAYKFARDAGDGRMVAILHMLAIYLLACLWLGGGVLIFFGIGMVVDRPDQSCGIGCVEPGQGHWGGPKIGSLISGLGLVLAAWIFGKSLERLLMLYRAKRAADPEHIHKHAADMERAFDKLIEERKQSAAMWAKANDADAISEIFEAAMRPNHIPRTEDKDAAERDVAGHKSATSDNKSDMGPM